MLDIKFIRENPEKVKEGVAKKRANIDIDELLKLDKEHRDLIFKIDSLRAEQNRLSQKAPNEEERKHLLNIKKEIESLGQDLKIEEEKLNNFLRQIPNLPLFETPEGGPDDFVVLREVGEKPAIEKPKDYIEIAQNLDLIDTERATKVSGSRFGYIKNEAALLEIALIQFIFEAVRQENFIPIIPPVLINKKSMQGMGYLDRGGEEVYHLEKDDLYLVGTSEQSIGPMHQDEIFDEKDLPKRYVSFSSCFRREAGSYGKDVRGILRSHQFDKVEMFSFTRPADSIKEHNLFLSLEEKLMRELGIPYRVLKIAAGDLGDPAAAKYDIEAWLPGQNQYRETHSTSNTTDFQARRLNIKYRNSITQKTEFVHMINGTAFAIGRAIIAILENYQTKTGSVIVPEVLRKYLGFSEIKRD
ncbi:MAG: serine--tRNA ligase [Parcubacteria group bacterium]|nr:serine--tRNA ligase [Parcubacteria group bacterium]